MYIGALEVTEQQAHNEFRTGGTVDCRIIDAKNAIEEHGIYDEFRPILKDSIVWDIGGAAGIDWFRTGKISQQWIVYELSETWYRYSISMSQTGLRFKPCPADFSIEAEQITPRRAILYAAGSIQYQEMPLTFLSRVSSFCSHILLKEVPCASKTFKSCQENVGLMWFLGIDDIINSLPDFELINNLGENGTLSHEHHVPAHIKVYALKNFIFKRKNV